jgi:hypothetical protein
LYCHTTSRRFGGVRDFGGQVADLIKHHAVAADLDVHLERVWRRGGGGFACLTGRLLAAGRQSEESHKQSTRARHERLLVYSTSLASRTAARACRFL